MPEHPRPSVIFDFGGVLLDWRPQHIIESFSADEQLRRRLRADVFGHPDWVEMDRGTLGEDEAMVRFAARIDRPLAEMQDLLGRVRESLTPIPETLALLDDLARRGIPLYGLSNMSAAMFEHLESRHDIWSVFRGIVISGRVRLIKPDPRIYAHVADTYALDPRHTAFVDDMPVNVEAAAAHGFEAIRFESPAQCRAALETWLQTRRPAA